MSFIQIIDYETDRPDEMRTLGEDFRGRRTDGSGGPTWIRTTQDRDNPSRYVTIVEFPSYEEAMANSERADTTEFAAQMAALCTTKPTFHNLDVLDRFASIVDGLVVHAKRMRENLDASGGL